MEQREPSEDGRGADVACRFVRAGGRAIHYRVAGDGPPVVLLHDSPRSSRLHLDTMRALSHRFRVYAPDTPGYGSSEPLAAATPTIGDFARALRDVLEALGLSGAPLYATHTSAKIALEYAAQATAGGSAAAPRLLLDGLSIPVAPADPGFIERYMQPFRIDERGGYLAAEWTRMRDMLRWFPWFDRRPEARMAAPIPDAAWIGDYAIDFLSAGPHYADAYAAAMRYDPRPALLRVRCPTLIAARADDVLYGSLERVPVAENAALRVARLPAGRAPWLAWLENTLAAMSDAGAVPPTLPRQPRDGDRYVTLAHGQIRLRCGGPQGGVPLLLLSTPTTLEAFAWQAALPHRHTIAPDLPGYGDSSSLADPSPDGLADAMAAMIRAMGHTRVDILAGGWTAALGATLAARHPGVVRRVVLDGAPDPPEPSAFAPRPFQASGGHLLDSWHMLRDTQVDWATGGARTTAPLLDPEALHAALVGVLKQPRHYGDIARAAHAAGGGPAFRQPALLLNRAGDAAYDGTLRLAAMLPDAIVEERPATIGESAALASAFLDAGRVADAA